MKTKVIIANQQTKSYLKFSGEKGYIDGYILIENNVHAIVVTNQGLGVFVLADLLPYVKNV